MGVPYSISRSPSDFLTLVAREGVTVLNQTPSAFYQMMEVDQGQKLALRYVIFGGEALEFARLTDWYRRHPDCCPILINMYGITETTVHVSYIAINQTTIIPSAGNLIGRGISDLCVYVLDGGLEPVPVGVAGDFTLRARALRGAMWGGRV